MESEMILKVKSHKLERMKKLVLSIARIEQEKKEANAEFKEEIDRLFEELNKLATEDEKQGDLDLPEPEAVQKKKRVRKDTEE